MSSQAGLSIIVSWRDRHELKLALPKLVEVTDHLPGETIVVNFGGSALLLQSQIQEFGSRVRVITVGNTTYFNKAAAQNIGAAHSRFRVLFFCDCDCIIDPVGLKATVAKVAGSSHTFATLAGVRETIRNSRQARHIVSFGYTLRLRTADGRSLSIVDNEEDADNGTRQAPGLLIVKRKDFRRVGGYNSQLHGWGWEDQDMICRLTLGLGLERLAEGTALHVSHDDAARLRSYPQVASRWESRDRMFRQALANYDRGRFIGTYAHDLKSRSIDLKLSGHKSRKAARGVSRAARPSLSVCLIARDEEATLARCLASLGDIEKEICVLDTGSQDATAKIAKSFGAKVRRFTDCNSPDGRIADFSAARNAALSMATKKWILQIDADEVLRAGHEQLKTALEWPAYDRLGVTIQSSGASWISGRVFRRRIAGKYTGRIHEYLECSGTYGVQCHIVIENLEDKRGKESASDRNIRLCLLSLEETPNNARLHHYLGNEYRALRMWKKAAACYRKAITLGNFRHGLFHSHYYLGVCYLLEGNINCAIAAALAAIRCDPRYAEGHCLLADAYSCIGELSFAKIWYQSALSCGTPPEDAVFPFQPWAYSEHPKKRLTAIRDTDASC
jgi:glycosyltransferase involved in cell wall biosynthesis